MSNSLLIVVSGPSGVGKDAVLSEMKDASLPCHFTVTATTRPKRSNETDGVDYDFVPKEAFQRMIENDELLEWAEVYGNYYGVPKSQVSEALNRGLDVIVKIDVQGAATIKTITPEALLIFVAPPSLDELAKRLQERMTESDDALRVRLETARKEMAESIKFDYIVTNHTGRIGEAVGEINKIIANERERIPPRRICL